MGWMRETDVKTSEPNTKEHWYLDPMVLGTVCGILSSIGYTVANICLRAVTHCDPVWVSAVKSVPTVVLVGPWLLVLMARSQALVSSGRVFVALCAAGLFGQLAGNVAFQWSLGVVGMAMAVPLCFGTMIIGGTIVGRWMLGEEVTRRTVVASAVLILSIAVLSFGAGEAHRALHTDAEDTPGLMFAGVAAACLCGVAYAILGAVIRYSASEGTPVSTILVTIGVVGMVALSAISAMRLGTETLWSTPNVDFAIMLLAGISNAFAFWALTKALQLTGVVYVNALNASQTALAALVGVLFFQEAITIPLVAGVLLTALGLLLMKRRRRQDQVPSSEASVPVSTAAAPIE